jgi:NAD(P)-dependent dehydrogenase (short-subunit alcohol dehydrogenase family)
MNRHQTILITGCSSGIGRATALEAAARGHQVFATARDRSSISDLDGHDGTVILRLDVTDTASISRVVEKAVAGSGRLDAVVANAGFGQYGAVEDVPPEDWRRQFDVNVFGALETARAALPPMREQRHGTVVFVSSIAGKISIPFAAPYCAAKHALEAIADALRVEVAPFGIRVVIVEPGPIASRFGERARVEVGRFLDRPGPYSRFYGGAERAMNRDFQMGMLPAEVVARTIVDAIESERPRTRYPLTSMARLFLPLKRLLPDRFFDWRMKKVLRLPDKA